MRAVFKKNRGELLGEEVRGEHEVLAAAGAGAAAGPRFASGRPARGRPPPGERETDRPLSLSAMSMMLMGAAILEVRNEGQKENETT